MHSNNEFKDKEPIIKERTNYTRALLIGIILVPFNAYWIALSELRYTLILTANPLFATPIFYLFSLVGVNALLHRFAPKYVFKPAELIIIYIMLVMSCTVVTFDYLLNLMSTMWWPALQASQENQWANMMFPVLPKELLVWDTNLLEGIINGKASFNEPAVLMMWLKPLAFWSTFILVSGWIMFCMNVILRKAWMENNKLTYPIVRLPLELAEGNSPNSILKSWALWAGFILAASLSLLEQLHQWVPAVTTIPTGIQWLNFPDKPPFNAANPITLSFYPFAIGLGFLVPLDVSFSFWFFYIFIRLEGVLGSVFGLSAIRGFPYVYEQTMGAWLAFGFVLIWSSRKYLKDVVRIAFQKDGSDAEEPVSYRIALLGLIGGAIFFMGFWMWAGMTFLWAFIVMGIYFLVSIAITRIRAEAGGHHSIYVLEPLSIGSMFSSSAVGATTLAAMSVSHWFWRLNRSHMMPSQMEAFKMAKDQGIRLKTLIAPIFISIVLATIVGMWACLHIFYRDGRNLVNGFSWTGAGEGYAWLENALSGGYKPEHNNWGGVILGGSFVLLLSRFRELYSWFPFHPLGYCMAYTMNYHWMPFFIAWICKFAILRYCGLKVYQSAVPFFLGLVLGDFITGSLWSLIGINLNVPAHRLFMFLGQFGVK